MTLRAGSGVLAPQVRLVDVSSGRILGTNVQRDPTVRDQQTHEVTHRGSITTVSTPDLVSATITQVNDGSSQLEVVLHNQRVDGDNPHRPVFPPWKYNDFSVHAHHATQDGTGTYVVTFGQRIRLDVRYAAGPWTKLVLARVTALAFSFPTGGSATLKVTAEDLLSALRIAPTRDTTYNNPRLSEEEIVRDVLHRAHFPVPYERTDRPMPTFHGRPPVARHPKSKTYYDVLAEIAGNLDCELYVDFVHRQAAAVAVPGAATSDEHSYDSTAIDASTEQRLRMEPARSRIRPQHRDDDWLGPDTGSDRSRYIELKWGRDLIDFTPAFEVWDLPTGVNASGSAHGTRGRESAELTSSELQTALRAELWPSTDRYPGMTPIDAIAARHEFFGDQHDATDNTASHPSSNLNSPRARTKARAEALKKLRKFLTATANTIGVPKLRPGIHVHILGLRPPFDGFYYVTQAVHTVDEHGYHTKLTLRRPGMLPPDSYLTAWRTDSERET